MHLDAGRWTEDELDRILQKASGIVDPGERIAFISEHFLDSPYQGSSLIGGAQQEEELVIDLSGMDCFTFLDYVEAMRLAGSFPDFGDMLRQVRYRGGVVSYRTRNHFFTDWAEYRPAFVKDASEEVGRGRAINLQKRLNQKEDGTPFLNGLEPAERTITYIPTDSIDQEMLQRLRTGDYAGIYSDVPGLDVSHVGIIIRKGASLFLRHASSKPGLRRVVDQDFKNYMKGKTGLIILRPTGC